MKNGKFYFLFALLLCFTLTACTNANRAYYDLKHLTKDIRTNGAYYTTGEWHAAWQEYQDIDERINKNYSKYSLEEKKEIEKDRAICIGAFTEAAINTSTDFFEKGKNAVNGVMDWWDKVTN